jgi:flagellar assembly factor FliW
MKIQTRQFGEIEFDDDLTLTFEDGLIGFETYKRYVLLRPAEEIFFWLTSVDEPELAFPLTPTSILRDDFPQKEGHESFAIVKLDRDPEKITVNLRAPVYIHHDERRGEQAILDDEKFAIDYNLFIREDEK